MIALLIIEILAVGGVFLLGWWCGARSESKRSYTRGYLQRKHDEQFLDYDD